MFLESFKLNLIKMTKTNTSFMYRELIIGRVVASSSN